MNPLSTAPKLSRTRLIDQTIDAVRELLAKNTVPVGEFLPSEGDLAAQFAVGRSTMREAIRTLEAQGLVKRIHGRGIQVVDQSGSASVDMLQLMLQQGKVDVRDVLEIRSTLEIQAAALAAVRATPAEIAAIEAAFHQLESSQALTEVLAADLDFHFTIARAAHNTVLMLIYQTIRPLFEEAVLTALKRDQEPGLRRQFHREIFEAIRSGREAEAADAMRRHLRGTKDVLDGKPQTPSP